MKKVDFLAIGDPVVDEFIQLKEARVNCAVDDADCTISMRWGDKIPFESATLVAGVGNSANAAVSARRLGLSAGLLGIVGDDAYGKRIQAVYKKEGLDRSYLEVAKGIPTNHHYVLSFESERTILVKHEAYRYQFPKSLPEPKTVYLSSLAESVGQDYYDALAAYVEARPDIFFAFQPGTFQMKQGTEMLARIYRRADIFFCNKEEAARILGGEAPLSDLFTGLMALGPKKVVITDGTNGAYAFDGTETVMIPMYPDARPPYERTGAGDAFASTVAAAMTLGKTFKEALLWGPVNSMSVVQKIGAQEGLLSRAALEGYLKDAPAEYATRPL
ncbi:MAG TPA: carbohydrate kinase family protein [Candidatus Paceibacterota bacterium]|nr:carbohydrate kinase family protein [Candidatus Paceibacterota bacterium]